MLKYCSVFFIWLHLFTFDLAFGWKEISPLNRRERIYSLDVYTKNSEIKSSYFLNVLDTIAAVGWSSTKGSFFLTKNGGKSWDIFETSTFFPFDVEFLEGDKVMVCGYNYLYDNAEVRFFDFSGKEISVFSFDGQSLPYSKNFFDCLEVDSKIVVAGYNGMVFVFDKIKSVWEKVNVDPNKVFLKIKKFNFNTSQGDIKLCFILGGNSFAIQNSIYFSNPTFDEWNILFNFHNNFSNIEIADFWFYGWDIENNFPNGFVVGTVDDSLIIAKSNPSSKEFEVVYLMQTFHQPLGVFVFDEGKSIIVSLDNGNFLFSDNFGSNWYYKELNFKKQFTSFNQFYFWSPDLLPDIVWRKLCLFGLGNNGLIAKYEEDISLGIENKRIPNECNFDKIKVYDILGRNVAEFYREELQKGIDFKLPKGIFVIVKFIDGNPCNTMICSFENNIFEILRLF